LLNPATFEDNRHRLPPLVVISTITSNGKIYAAASRLVLPVHTENVEIDYTALRLPIPERARFRYKLESVDKDWEDAGTRREAFFSSLGPGDYRFRVMASNSDGVWNDAGAFVDFYISPAYYQTTWFHLLCIIAFLALLGALYQLHLRQVTAQERIRLEGRLRKEKGLPANCTTLCCRIFRESCSVFKGELTCFPVVRIYLAPETDCKALSIKRNKPSTTVATPFKGCVRPR